MNIARRWLTRSLFAAALASLTLPVAADDFFLTPRTTTTPGYQFHPSPADWRDVNMYQLFTDRFADGNPGNNNSRGWYATDGNRHFAMGGDWAGIRQKLDYLEGMGVNAIWISGVQINEQGVDTRYTPYHAYHPTDFYRVEPMFGTFQELKDLIDDAHSRGIYVIIDVVINHMADLNGLGGDLDKYYHPFGGGNLFWWNNNKRHAWPLDNLAYFHNNGKIVNWSDGGQILNGAFVGTDDLKTSDPFVRNHLLNAFKNLIDATDCDGFRVDAIKHVERDFLMSWADDMRKHAASRGKTNFILFGENFTYDDNAVADHCKDFGYAFNSALYFPMQLTIKEVFAYEQSTRKLQDRLNNLPLYGEGAQNLVTFMDNHDVDRIALESGDAWLTKLKPALTFLYTGTPVPCLFYGTEHGFNQGGRRNNGLEDGDYQREVMFNYGYQPGNAQGDKFQTSELYTYIATLNRLRRDHPALTRGTMVNRWKNDNNKGLFAYTRTLGDEEALVVFNTDWNTQSLTPAVGKPDGTVYVNLLDPAETATVSGGTLNISVGSKGSKIFFAGNSASTVDSRCTRTAVTLTFSPNKGPLENATGPVILSVRADGAPNATDYPMTAAGDTWVFTLPTTNITDGIEFWFRDSATPPVYDNRDGDNWSLVTRDCWKTGVELAFVGNITTWPASGDLDPGEDLWIDLETWPKNAAFEGEIVYSADAGATWLAAPAAPNGETSANSKWNANLGPFPRGAAIQFAVKMTGENGDIWNSNGGSNHWISVNSNIVPIDWVGNAYHWPESGNLTSLDDLWVNIESRPVGAGKTGIVVFTSDDGATWQTRTLAPNGTTETADRWNLNLGRFTPGTTIRYALMIADEDGGQTWDNNGGTDYAVTVNAAGSSVQWFGSTRSFGALPPALNLAVVASNQHQLVMTDLRRDVVYSICRSTNMVDWEVIDQITGWFTGDVQAITPPGPGETAFFYCLQVDRAPALGVEAGEAVYVTAETFPIGGATGATVVYSADDGTTWSAIPMTRTGTSGVNDTWTANLGAHPAGTTVRYAVEIVDDEATSLWDNNAAQNYQVLITP